MNISELLDVDICARIVQMLLHFLWQGLLIAVAVAGLNVAARRKSAAFRYRVAAAALLLMAAFLPVTFFAMAPETLQVAAQPRPSRVNSETSGNRNVPDFDAPVSLDASPLTVAPEVVEPDITADIVEPPPRTPAAFWVSASPYIVAAYFAGVVLMMTRLAFAFAGGERLRRSAAPIVDATLLRRFADKAKTFGVRVMPAIRCCEHLATPIIVGVFKPTVLLPVCILTELSPSQLEAVLAHELAHIRRWDHVTNVIQRIIESLLFFHPAVWYVSRCVSRERENCCDDMVVSHGTEAACYAELLVRVSELSQTSHAPSAAALAASGDRSSSLRPRILRLLGHTTDTPVRLTRVGVVICTMCVAVLMGLVCLNVQGQPSGEPSLAEKQRQVRDFLDQWRVVWRKWHAMNPERLNADRDMNVDASLIIDLREKWLGIERGGRVADEDRVDLPESLTCQAVHITLDATRHLHGRVVLKHRGSSGQQNWFQEIVRVYGVSGDAGFYIDIKPGGANWTGAGPPEDPLDNDLKPRAYRSSSRRISVSILEERSAEDGKADADRNNDEVKRQRRLDEEAAAAQLDPLNVKSIRERYGDPDLRLAVLHDSELNGGVPLDGGQAKAEHYYLAYLPRAKDSAERCYIYSQLSALFSTNWHRDKGESPDYPKSRRYAAEAIKAEPNRLGKVTIRARARVRNGPDLSTEENFAGRLEFYKWLTSWNESTARRNWIPLPYQVGREDRYFPSFMRLLENVKSAETSNLTSLNTSDKQPQARLLRIVREVPGTDAAKIAQQKFEELWGEAVDGVQAMLIVERRDWEIGDEPALKAMIRNLGDTEYKVARAQQLCELGVDGRWYRWAGTSRVQSTHFPPGKTFEDIAIQLDDHWQDKETGAPLALKVGRFTVRLAFQPQQRNEAAPIRVVSNPVEIRVAVKEAAQNVFTARLLEDFVIDLDTGRTIHNDILHQQPKEHVNKFDLEWDDDGGGSVLRYPMTRMFSVGGASSPVQARNWAADRWHDIARSLRPSYLGADVTYLAVRTDESNLAIVKLSGRKTSEVTLAWSLARVSKTVDGRQRINNLPELLPRDEWGPIVERDMTTSENKATTYLNLTTGNYIKPTWGPNPSVKDLRGAKADVFHLGVQANLDQKMCLDVEHLVAENAWKLTGNESKERFLRLKARGETEKNTTPAGSYLDPSVPYLFQNRSGSLGVLELVPKRGSLVIRYKMLLE